MSQRTLSRLPLIISFCLSEHIKSNQKQIYILLNITCWTEVKMLPKGAVLPAAILVYDLWSVMHRLKQYQPFSFISRHPVSLRRGITCGERVGGHIDGWTREVTRGADKEEERMESNNYF